MPRQKQKPRNNENRHRSATCGLEGFHRVINSQEREVRLGVSQLDYI